MSSHVLHSELVAPHAGQGVFSDRHHVEVERRPHLSNEFATGVEDVPKLRCRQV